MRAYAQKHYEVSGKMAYKKLRGVNLPQKKQLLIRAICLNCDERPEHERQKIQRLCDKCGGAYSAALYELMTTEMSVTAISLKHHISESVLYEIRKKFYESWF